MPRLDIPCSELWWGQSWPPFPYPADAGSQHTKSSRIHSGRAGYYWPQSANSRVSVCWLRWSSPRDRGKCEWHNRDLYSIFSILKVLRIWSHQKINVIRKHPAITTGPNTKTSNENWRLNWIVFVNQGSVSAVGTIDEIRTGMSLGYFSPNAAYPIDPVNNESITSELNNLQRSCQLCGFPFCTRCTATPSLKNQSKLKFSRRNAINSYSKPTLSLPLTFVK